MSRQPASFVSEANCSASSALAKNACSRSSACNPASIFSRKSRERRLRLLVHKSDTGLWGNALFRTVLRVHATCFGKRSNALFPFSAKPDSLASHSRKRLPRVRRRDHKRPSRFPLLSRCNFLRAGQPARRNCCLRVLCSPAASRRRSWQSIVVSSPGSLSQGRRRAETMTEYVGAMQLKTDPFWACLPRSVLARTQNVPD